MPPSQSQVSKLPVSDDTWLVDATRMRAWVKEEDSLPTRPHLILIVSANTGLIFGSDLMPEEPSPKLVADALFHAMRHPPSGLAEPQQPHAIAVGNPALLEPLQDLLKNAGLDTQVFTTKLADEFYDIIRQLESHLRGGVAEIPGMLESPGVTVELLQGAFEAAAAFYRAAPWVHLSNDQVLAIRHPNESDYRYAIVMGQGGVEYGIVMYRSWSDVKRLALDNEDPLRAGQDATWNSLFFDTADFLPFDDLDVIEEHNLEIASEEAYPVGVILQGQGPVRRFTRQDWEWFEAALRAVPVFVRDHLRPDAQGDYEPVEIEIPAKTTSGEIKVGMKYPAGELPLEEQPAEWLDWGQKDPEEEDVTTFDPRTMEAIMSGLMGEVGAITDADDPALSRAQQLMYQAWEETNPARRIAMAREALAISAKCADAYVLLAEEEADTVKRALELYQKGMEAGESALGEQFFKENEGKFWGLLKTRPYMRARRGVAQTLWRLKRFEEAIEHYRELLRLNPNDNQGNRYALLDIFLGLERYDDALAILKQYEEEWSAVWLYSRALLEYKKGGDSPKARRALKQALEQNPFVPAYLTDQKRIPGWQVNSYGWGDESEAVYYASENLNYWRRTPGAVDWLRSEIERGRKRKKTPGGTRARKSRKTGEE
jgi:hypothetical protein